MKTLIVACAFLSSGCMLIAAGIVESQRKPLNSTPNPTNSSLGNAGESCESRAQCNSGLKCIDKTCVKGDKE